MAVEGEEVLECWRIYTSDDDGKGIGQVLVAVLGVTLLEGLAVALMKNPGGLRPSLHCPRNDLGLGGFDLPVSGDGHLDLHRADLDQRDGARGQDPSGHPQGLRSRC